MNIADILRRFAAIIEFISTTAAVGGVYIKL
jgi:hypothetical protein